LLIYEYRTRSLLRSCCGGTAHAHPHNNNINTDHLLSFFLGGGENAGGSSIPDFAPSGGGGNTRGRGGGGGPSFPNHTSRSASAAGGDDCRRPRLLQKRESYSEEDDDAIGAPPTPAVNFYAHPHHHQHQQAPYGGGGTTTSSDRVVPGAGGGGSQQSQLRLHHHHQQQNANALPGAILSSSSSSSSLSSAAAALVSGGPFVYHQQPPPIPPHHQPTNPLQPHNSAHHHQLQRTSSTGHSPISPAEMIGIGYENLMLPPPARPPSASNASRPDSASAADSPSSEQQGRSSGAPTTSFNPHQTNAQAERERHIAWLQDLNAMAKAASSGGVPVAPIAPAGGMMMPFPGASNAYLGHHHPGSMAPHMAPGGGMVHGGAAAMMMMHPHAHAPSAPPKVETAEKRAKRLERNRESARKSRRRKKERLTTLEAQVNQMHCKIEAERRLQVNAMVPAFRELRQTTDADQLARVLCSAGLDCEISRSVIEFQYTALKQLILPRYHKLMVWLSLQDESFFVAGKDQYASRIIEKSNAGSSKAAKQPSTKISSKQVGDELTNGARKEKKGGSKRRVTFKDNDEDESVGETDGQSNNLTPYANDAARVWPLLCYEMSFSVEQEERFVATHKKVQEFEGLGTDRSQMAAAVRTGDSLREAVESLSRVVAQREENSVLSPAQLAAYRNWLSSNEERRRAVLDHRESMDDTDSSSFATESSLQEICRRLNEVLQISKSEK